MNEADNDRRIREVVMDWLVTSEDEVSGPMRHYAMHYIKTAEAENVELKDRLAKIAALLLPPHVEKRKDIIEKAWTLADGMKRKCPSTYTHSTLGKLACEKDEAHLHRRGDVEHLGAGVKWMSV